MFLIFLHWRFLWILIAVGIFVISLSLSGHSATFFSRRLDSYFLRGIFLMDQIIVARLDGLVVSQRMLLVRTSDYVKDMSKFQHTHVFHM